MLCGLYLENRIKKILDDSNIHKKQSVHLFNINGLSTIHLLLILIVIIQYGTYSNINDQIHKNNLEYSVMRQVNSEMPIVFDTVVAKTKDILYIYSDLYQSLSLYTIDGSYKYSFYIPHSMNGHSTAYQVQDTIYIRSRDGELYKYLDGEYEGKLLSNQDSVTVYNDMDNIEFIIDVPHFETPIQVIGFDDDIVLVSLYSYTNNDIDYVQISNNEVTEINIKVHPFTKTIFENNDKMMVKTNSITFNDVVLIKTNPSIIFIVFHNPLFLLITFSINIGYLFLGLFINSEKILFI